MTNLFGNITLSILNNYLIKRDFIPINKEDFTYVFKKTIKKYSSLLFLSLLLLIPTITYAQSKYVSLITSHNSDSASCTCPSATVKGGAMVGGDGINYDIAYHDIPGIKYISLKSGHCKSNTSFNNYNFYSPTGYSVKLRLKETQHNTSKPGIGWGRIDY